MQPLNHDMDELFRKAAKDYPLKTGNGDWDNISGQLVSAAAPGILKNNKTGKGAKYVRLILLFLLLLVAFGWFLLSKMDQDNNRVTNRSGPGTQQQKTFDSASERESAGLRNRFSNDVDLFSKNPPAKFSNKEIAKRSGNPIDHPGLRPSTESILVSSNIDARHQFHWQDSLGNFPVNGITLSIVPDTIIARGKKEIPSLNRQAGIYIGLMGGPDFSEVKSQGITKAGYNLGLLVGYRFNRTLSIESGVLWSRKKYYTAGKYFSKSKIGPSMPAGMEIVEVEGQSSLFEIPVKLKYDLFRKERSDLFVTAGISTNIYVKEKNNYLTKMNGIQEWQVGLYDNLPCAWFSLINVSAGYERSLGKFSRIRIEPYLKIPIKKVGMGSIPVFSTGINVAVSNLLSRQ